MKDFPYRDLADVNSASDLFLWNTVRYLINQSVAAGNNKDHRENAIYSKTASLLIRMLKERGIKMVGVPGVDPETIPIKTYNEDNKPSS